MIAEYRSQRSDTIAYLAHYLDQFYTMKHILLEVGVTKDTLAKVDEYWREIQHPRTQMSHPVAPSGRCRIHDYNREQGSQLRMDLIHRESHFNFRMIYPLSYFSDHIRKFGNIQMYSTEFGELAHWNR